MLRVLGDVIVVVDLEERLRDAVPDVERHLDQLQREDIVSQGTLEFHEQLFRVWIAFR